MVVVPQKSLSQHLQTKSNLHTFTRQSQFMMSISIRDTLYFSNLDLLKNEPNQPSGSFIKPKRILIRIAIGKIICILLINQTEHGNSKHELSNQLTLTKFSLLSRLLMSSRLMNYCQNSKIF